MTRNLLLLPLVLTIACTSTEKVEPLGEEWEPYNLVVRHQDHIRFSFPASGFAFEQKDNFVADVYGAIESNAEILGIPEYNEYFKVFFHSSRSEVEKFTGMAAAGIANVWTRELHIAAYTDEESDSTDFVTNPPIIHEMMHLMSCTTWGYPDQNLQWLNEGLATYAGDNCNGYTIAEIYRYMLDEGHAYSAADFDRHFYELEEMIGYHQSAYYVECLIEAHGMEKFQEFWQSNHANFDEVYGMSFEDFIKTANERVIRIVPEKPNIDWDEFMKGCF